MELRKSVLAIIINRSRSNMLAEVTYFGVRSSETSTYSVFEERFTGEETPELCLARELRKKLTDFSDRLLVRAQFVGQVTTFPPAGQAVLERYLFRIELPDQEFEKLARTLLLDGRTGDGGRAKVVAVAKMRDWIKVEPQHLDEMLSVSLSPFLDALF